LNITTNNDDIEGIFTIPYVKPKACLLMARAMTFFCSRYVEFWGEEEKKAN
jgi:hypothetical protein